MSKQSIYRMALALVIFLSVYCFSFVNTHPKPELLRLNVMHQQAVNDEIADEKEENKSLQVPDTTFIQKALNLLEKFMG